MSGWELVSVRGDQTFTFPAGYILEPGETVKVVSGRGATGNGDTVFKWTGAYIWNNDGDSGVYYMMQLEGRFLNVRRVEKSYKY